MSPRKKRKRRKRKYKPKSKSYIYRVSVSFKQSQWRSILKRYEDFKEARGKVTLSFFLRLAILRGLEMHQAAYGELKRIEE